VRIVHVHWGLHYSWAFGLLAAAALIGAPASARAAEIAWQAPVECQRAEVVSGQVEKLVGRRLADVEAVTFEVEVSIEADATHRVLLRTLATGSAPRERVITAASCASVTDAVSVAIALTINEEEQRMLAAAEADASASATAEAAPNAEPAAERGSPPALFVLGLGPQLDAGALPNATPGLDVGAALELGLLRVGLSFAAFVPQSAELPDASGGRFDFVFAGVDLCGHPLFGELHLLACAGFELGRIGARGTGVRNWREGDAAWYAPRVLLGVGYGFAKVVRVFLRGGVAVPLARREFQVDGERVHRPGSTALRLGVGVELVL
jgi:hypothetical protein